MSKTFTALMVLMGTIIGAGILGIPYVVSQSGFPIGIMHIVLLGILMAIIMLYLGEIVLRTKGNHQLSGYAEKYLGKKGKILMFLAFAAGIYSAILAYLIAEGKSLSYLIFNSPIHQFELGIIFWIFLSAITYFGIKALEEGDTVGVIVVFTMIVSISVYFANKISITNLTSIFPSNLFVPFGVVLFAFLGFSAIPELKRILDKEQKPLRGIIITAYLLTALIYIIFAAIVLGFMGNKTPEVATIALGKPFIVLGMITMFTAYLSLSVAMIDSYRFDFKKSRRVAWLCTIIIPLILFIILSLTNNAAFTQVLGIGGILSGGLTAVIVLFMAEKAKTKGKIKPYYSIPYSKLFKWLITAIFALAAILEIKNILF
jgi:amino acid permease